MKQTILAGLLVLSAAQSDGVDIPIRKRGAEKSSLDLAGLRAVGDGAAEFRATLEHDLVRSGWFTVTREGGAIAVAGTCVAQGAGLRATIAARVVATGRSNLSRRFPARDNPRALAHEVADALVQAIAGVPGIASTRIAMVRSLAGRKDVFICDSDGGAVTQVTRAGAVCLFPSWGNDRNTLVYTSYHRGFPDVYRIDLRRNQRTRLSSFPGLNAGADLSPDEQQMALTLSKDGNPDLYILTLGNRRLTRLTRTPAAAEASPSWSPDGSRIVYVSDKSGSPQLYIIDRFGRGERQLTSRGAATENVAPDWGPGDRIAYSSRRGGRYQVCVIEPDGGKTWQLTTEYLNHEEPSWAPDGRHIACTRTVGFRSNVYILDTLGDKPQVLTALEGNWYSPDWSRK